MSARTELDLIKVFSDPSGKSQSALDLEWEKIRRGLESLKPPERRQAAAQAVRLWRSLPRAHQRKFVRLLSGPRRVWSSTGSIEKLNQSTSRLAHLAASQDDPMISAEAHLAEGLLYVSTGELGKAIISTELSKALFATSPENKYDFIRASIQLGDILSMSGDKPGAISTLVRARQLCLEIEEAPLLGSVSQALGVLYLESGNLQSASRCFHFVCRASEVLASPKRLIRGKLGLALCLLRSGQLPQAREAISEIMQAAASASLHRELCLAYEYTGELELLEGHWTTSLLNYRRAFSLSVSRHLGRDIRHELHRKLAEYWLSFGRRDRAAQHLKRSVDMGHLAPDFEDRLAIARLEILMSSLGEEAIIDKLIAHAEEASSLGYGYEHLLACHDVARAFDRSFRQAEGAKWWHKVEFLAKGCGAEPLLERWRKERLERLKSLGSRQGTFSIDEETPVSHLALELPPVDLGSFGIITKSRRLHEQASSIAQIAPTTVPVLIQGESGTGKELFARLVHDLSPRANGPFLAINCGALPNEILESELFGHRRGAFTGAMTDKIGLFRAAHQGTLFLDEIGEMSPSAQTKLLRVLETGELRRIGDTQIERVDVRIVAATNVDLNREVGQRKFRKDLYYRLKGLEVLLPPLRERMGDIPLLAQHFLERAGTSSGKHVELPFATLQWLMGLPWPGNVRELRLGVERAFAMAQDRASLQPYHFFGTEQPARQVSLPDELEAIERERVIHALESAGWNKTSAAKLLGMSRTTLAGRIKKLGIEDREK